MILIKVPPLQSHVIFHRKFSAALRNQIDLHSNVALFGKLDTHTTLLLDSQI